MHGGNLTIESKHLVTVNVSFTKPLTFTLKKCSAHCFVVVCFAFAVDKKKIKSPKRLSHNTHTRTHMVYWLIDALESIILVACGKQYSPVVFNSDRVYRIETLPTRFNLLLPHVCVCITKPRLVELFRYVPPVDITEYVRPPPPPLMISN